MAEAIEDMPDLVRSDADAFVGDGNARFFAAQAQADRFAGRREFDGIIDHGQQHLAQAGVITGERECGRRLFADEDDALSLAQRICAHGDVAKQLGEIDRADVKRELEILQPGELQQIQNQALQPAALDDHLVVIGADILFAADHAIAERLQRAADDGDGRFELVGDIREKVLLLNAQLFVVRANLFQPLGEDIHRMGERADFVRLGHVRTRLVTALRQGERDLLQLGDGTSEHAGEEERKQHGQREGKQQTVQQDCRAGHLRVALLAQRGGQQDDAQHLAFYVHDGHAGGQVRFAVHLRLNEGRLAHEA